MVIYKQHMGPAKCALAALALAAAMMAALAGCTGATGEKGDGAGTGTTTTGGETTTETILREEAEHVIDEILSFIKSNYRVPGHDRDVLDQYPEEFARIAALGEGALPYLDEIMSDPEILKPDDLDYVGPMDYRLWSLAIWAKYVIKPELYDLSFPSPDGKYAVKASLYSVMNATVHYIFSYYNLRVVELEADSIVYISNLWGYENIKVEWSPDSLYAAISSGWPRYFYETDVFDVRNGNYLTLPNTDETSEITGRDMRSFLDHGGMANVGFYFDGWVAEDKIKIAIHFRLNDDGDIGWYIFDLTEQKVIDFLIVDD